jgi:Holliday junction resolvase RusA-like endonuclease
MKITILFTVPGEPVAQGRPRFANRGSFVSVYDPKPSKDYKKYVALHARQAYAWSPIRGAVKMSVDVYKKMPKSFTKKQKEQALSGELLPIVKPDTDNYVKGIKDALNGICYMDDAQVVDESVRKFYSDEPRVEIGIWEV